MTNQSVSELVNTIHRMFPAAPDTADRVIQAFAQFLDHIELPEKKDWSIDPVDEWEQADWVGYNKAIDLCRAAITKAVEDLAQ